MKPQILEVNQIMEWKKNTWVHYASESRGNRRVILECNLVGDMRVVVRENVRDNAMDKQIIWSGGCVETAIERYQMC
jgi:hypothetical protein